MSEEIAVTAILHPAPEKLHRLKQLFEQSPKWQEDNEPGTLEFSVYETVTGDGVQWFLHERYASQSAVEEHMASEHYKEFFRQIMEEGLFEKPPVILSGNIWKGLRRES